MNTRSYDMRNRAAAAASTREAIVRATLDTFSAARTFDVALAPIAERAGVTVKTLLRHFGSRDALIETAWQRAYDDVVAERTPPPRDPAAALALLVQSYEVRGEVVLGVLADDDADPRARRMNDAGRIGHRAWVEEVFGGSLPAPGPARTRAVDALVVATDVFTWKLLRLDRRLPVEEVLDRMRFLSDAVLVASRDGATPRTSRAERQP